MSSIYKEKLPNNQKGPKNATKNPFVLNKQSYEERLKMLCMTTLGVRRERSDLVQLLKIEKAIFQIVWVSTHTRCAPRRGNIAPLRKKTVQNCPTGFNLLLNRMVNNWSLQMTP